MRAPREDLIVLAHGVGALAALPRSKIQLALIINRRCAAKTAAEALFPSEGCPIVLREYLAIFFRSHGSPPFRFQKDACASHGWQSANCEPDNITRKNAGRWTTPVALSGQQRRDRCPLWVKSGHRACRPECLLWARRRQRRHMRSVRRKSALIFLPPHRVNVTQLAHVPRTAYLKLSDLFLSVLTRRSKPADWLHDLDRTSFRR